MRNKIAVQTSLTVTDVKASVKSLSGSVKFLKKILPYAICTMIFNRIEYEKEYFSNHKLKDSSYQCFTKKIPKGHNLFRIYHWIISSFDCLEKKFLKKVYLIFAEKENNQVIEHFCFDIEYDENQKKSGKSEEVLDKTVAVFKCLQLLSEHQKLSGNSIDISIQLLLKDDIPNDYVTPKYVKSDPIVPVEANDFSTIGDISTGYHRLQIIAIGKLYSTDGMSNAPIESSTEKEVNASQAEINRIEAESIEANIDHEPDQIEVDIPVTPLSTNRKRRAPKTNVLQLKKKEETKQKGGKGKKAKKQQAASSEDNDNDDKEEQKTADVPECEPFEITSVSHISVHTGTTEAVEYEFNCICQITKNISQVDVIQCSKCHKFEHTVCLGFKVESLIEKPHYCYVCCEEDDTLTSPDYRMLNMKKCNRVNFAILRLILYCCSVLKKTVNDILDLCSLGDRQKRLRMLVNMKIVQRTDEGIIQPNLPDMESRLKKGKYFYEYVDSMVLE